MLDSNNNPSLTSSLNIIKDPATLGIYYYLLTFPEHYCIEIRHLQDRFDKGTDFIRSRISQLKELGFIQTEVVKDEKGRFRKSETKLIRHK